MRKLSDFDLRLLQVFTTIVETGGFSAAQFALNMHQSTISTRMHDLEVRLGMTLCQRGRRGFRLTPDGEKVYALCQTLFQHINHFENQIDGIRKVSHGHITLALTDNLATNPDCHVQQAIRAFCARYSKVTLETVVWDSYQIEMMLLEGKIELGITSSEVQKDGLTYTPLFSEHQSLYCASDHPILQHPRPITEDDLMLYPLVDRGLSHHITPLSHCEAMPHLASSTNMEATAHLLLSGNFIGYLPDHYAAIWVNRGELVRIVAPDWEYKADFHLTTLDNKEHSLAATKLIEAIVENHIDHKAYLATS